MAKKKGKTETGCCPIFNPKPWENKTVNFKGKLFVKDRVRSIFHIPLNFAQVMTRNMNKITKARALTKTQLVISDENSLWGADVYISTGKKIKDSKNVTIPGTFLSKVFEGPYKDMGKWIKSMEKYVSGKGKKMNKLYFFYTTCPKCAKVYGKNYVVLLAKIN